MDYKSTLNMPKSGFPMRAGLPMREPDMLSRWQEMDLYNDLLKKNEVKPRFSLQDGPPPSWLTAVFSRILRGDIPATAPRPPCTKTAALFAWTRQGTGSPSSYVSLCTEQYTNFPPVCQQ